MKKLLTCLAVIFPTSGFTQMDELTYITEVSALAKALALQEECQISIDPDAMVSFVTNHFEGRESNLLSELDGHVSIAAFSLKDASDLQKRLQCAVAEKYIANHSLGSAD